MHSLRIYAGLYRGRVLRVYRLINFTVAPHQMYPRIQNILFCFVWFANYSRYSRGKLHFRRAILASPKNGIISTQKKCETPKSISGTRIPSILAIIENSFFFFTRCLANRRNWTTWKKSHPTSDCFTISLSYFFFLLAVDLILHRFWWMIPLNWSCRVRS